jgi:hypothetical protein
MVRRGAHIRGVFALLESMSPEVRSIGMTLRWTWILAAACVACLLGWLALVPNWHDSEDSTSSDESTPAAREIAAPASPPSAAASSPAPAQPLPADDELRVRTLHGLASDNAGDRIEALRAVGDRHAVELLPDLLALEPARDPELAPTLISVSTKLAAESGEAQRSAAATRLAAWLSSEAQRTDADARGNQSLLIEALGKLNTPEAVAALSQALGSDQLPVHVATLATDGLARIGDPSARTAVEQFRTRVAEKPAADSFERELRSEALAAADRALAKLPH